MSHSNRTKRTTAKGARVSRSAAAEREFRALLDAAVDAIIVIDHQGTIEEFSLAAERLFGYRAAEVTGSNVNLLMPEPYQAAHDGYMQHFAETGEQRIIGIGREVRARRKDGSSFPCDLAVGRVNGVDPPRFVGIIRDISARQLGEEQLRRSETELRLAQQLANLGNYVVHLDGSEPDYFSPQMYRILGAEVGSKAGPLSEYLDKWVHPADVDRLRDAFAEMESGSGSLDVEYRVTLHDGAAKHLHHIAQTIYDEHRRPAKHIGTVHDVTDRRHAEDLARQLQERLTHFARLSTMGEMAAGLAHEINQPLSAIATYSQACQRMLALPQHDPAGAHADQRPGAAGRRGHPPPAKFRQESPGQARAGRLHATAGRSAHAGRNGRAAAQHPAAHRVRKHTADRVCRPDPAAAGDPEPGAQRH
jgi:two-component system sensor kinase FixL